MIRSGSSKPFSNHDGEIALLWRLTCAAEFAMVKPSIAHDLAGIQPANDIDSTQRLLELDKLAQEAFESPEAAAEWMRRPHPMLDGEEPRECANSSSGADRVEANLVAIKYGSLA